MYILPKTFYVKYGTGSHIGNTHKSPFIKIWVMFLMIKYLILLKRESFTNANTYVAVCLQAIKTWFAAVLESEDAMDAAASLLMFKLRWCKDQAKKEMVKGYLAAECHKVTPQPGPVQQPEVPTTLTPSTSKAQDFINFEEDDDTFSSVESEIISYLRTAETEMDVLQQFPINKGSLSEEKCCYSVQRPCWEAVQFGKSGTVSQEEQAQRQKVWEAASHEV